MDQQTLKVEILNLYLQVGRQFGDALTQAAHAHDLTPMQAMTLMGVAEGPMPTKDIARHLHCDPSNATGLVDQLEKRGLVRRVTPAHDRRVRTIEASDEGLVVGRHLAQAKHSAAGVLERLSSKDQAELHRLLTILRGGPDSR